jgi:hypothetical protein
MGTDTEMDIDIDKDMDGHGQDTAADTGQSSECVSNFDVGYLQEI